jgi:predicted MPP superfamily phosphohydrolase
MTNALMPAEIHSTEPEHCLADNSWMAALRKRPPIAERQPECRKKRLQVEHSYRKGHEDKTELTPVTLARGLLIFFLHLFLKCLGLYKRGNANALDLQLREMSLSFPDLPPDLEGLRILHLSDLHLPRRFPEFSQKAGKLLNGLKVDLCVLTGDYRWGYYGPLDHVPQQIATILEGVSASFGSVAVLGNHDTFLMAETLEKAGLPFLFNEGAPLVFGDTTLWLCGIDDPHIYGCDSISDALRDAPADSWKVLLAHSPERITEAEEAGISLYLCGHTHGGQIRLPLIGAPSSNAKCRRDQIMGVWRYKSLVGHTSPGLGTTDLPVRYHCPPEATVFTLTGKTSTEDS